MRLAVEMLRAPAYPDAEFERMKSQRLRGLENVPSQPEQLSAQELQRHLSPFAKGDPQYQPTREEQLAELKAVTLADVRKFHDDFYGASHGEFVVVGEVDQAAVKKLAAELLGSWNSPAAYVRVDMKAVPLRTEAMNKRGSRLRMDERTRSSRRGYVIAYRRRMRTIRQWCLANYMFGGSITARMPNRIPGIARGPSYGASLALHGSDRRKAGGAVFRDGELQSGEHAEGGSELRR